MAGLIDNITDSILFPIPESASYDHNSFHQSMLWIPKSNQTESAIPCLWLPHEEYERVICTFGFFASGICNDI
jgi:hypothetical protein